MKRLLLTLLAAISLPTPISAEELPKRLYGSWQFTGTAGEAVIGELTLRTEESVIGMVDVKTTFKAPKVGVVAGSIVSEGRVELGAKARLLRDGVVIYEGSIVSLRRFKDDVESVNEGLECGIGLSDYKDIKQGDVIEILGEVAV